MCANVASVPAPVEHAGILPLIRVENVKSPCPHPSYSRPPVRRTPPPTPRKTKMHSSSYSYQATHEFMLPLHREKSSSSYQCAYLSLCLNFFVFLNHFFLSSSNNAGAVRCAFLLEEKTQERALDQSVSHEEYKRK